MLVALSVLYVLQDFKEAHTSSDLCACIENDDGDDDGDDDDRCRPNDSSIGRRGVGVGRH